MATRRIGLSLGADICWPICYEEIVRALDLDIEHEGERIDFEVERAAKNLPPEPAPAEEGSTLLPASATTAADALAAAAVKPAAPSEDEQKREEEREADAVFAKLKSLKGPDDPASDD